MTCALTGAFSGTAYSFPGKMGAIYVLGLVFLPVAIARRSIAVMYWSSYEAAPMSTSSSKWQSKTPILLESP
ncbi:hypothetical protein BDW67DRAFT_159042 [Aspergillus spinulosporus]